MGSASSPEAIDTRMVLRSYAWVTASAGLLVYMWPAALLPDAQFPAATPPAPWAITRVGAALVFAAGVCAAGIAGIAEPAARRRALYGLALSHLAFGALFFVQWYAIFDGLLPPLVGGAPLLSGGILLYVAATCSARPTMRRAPVSDRVERLGHSAVASASAPVDTLRTRYEDHLEQAARQEERTRLARDLHDAVKQQLFAIQTAAATAEVRFDSDPAGARASLAHVRAAAHEGMTEMAAMIDQLQAAPVENTGLVDALRRQCEALRLRTGADVQLAVGTLPPDHALPPGAQQNLFRGAQEGLANVGRHARAAHVTVSLGATGHSCELTIEDDGVGFDPVETQAGMGLANMPARAAAAGGSFTLRSAVGQGTRLRFAVPVSTRSALRYSVMALAWSLPTMIGIRYLAVYGVSDHPWILGATVIAAIAAARYARACFVTFERSGRPAWR